jgi:hypothetical protein
MELFRALIAYFLYPCIGTNSVPRVKQAGRCVPGHGITHNYYDRYIFLGG